MTDDIKKLQARLQRQRWKSKQRQAFFDLRFFAGWVAAALFAVIITIGLLLLAP